VIDELPEEHIVKTKYLKACYGKSPDGEETRNDEQSASS